MIRMPRDRYIVETETGIAAKDRQGCKIAYPGRIGCVSRRLRR
jgi:hypothetical protein